MERTVVTSSDIRNAKRLNISMPNAEKQYEYEKLSSEKCELEKSLSMTRFIKMLLIVVLPLWLLMGFLPAYVSSFEFTGALKFFTILALLIVIVATKDKISKRNRDAVKIEEISEKMENLKEHISIESLLNELSTLDVMIEKEKEELERIRAERLERLYEYEKLRCESEFNGDYGSMYKYDMQKEAELEELKRHNQEMERIAREENEKIELAERRRAKARKKYADSSATIATGVGRGLGSSNKTIAEMERAEALADML